MYGRLKIQPNISLIDPKVCGSINKRTASIKHNLKREKLLKQGLTCIHK